MLKHAQVLTVFLILSVVCGCSSSDDDTPRTSFEQGSLATGDKIFRGPEKASARKVIQADDGGFVIVGEVEADDHHAIWVIRTNSAGNMEWNRTFGYYQLRDAAESVVQSRDGGYVVVGSSRSFNYPASDMCLFGVDADGITQWTKAYGGIPDSNWYDRQMAYGKDIAATEDGGYLAAGEIRDYGDNRGRNGVFLVRTDEYGDTVWTRDFELDTSDFEEASSVIQTTDGGFALVVSGNWHAFLVKTDENGYPVWSQLLETYAYALSRAFSIAQTDDNGFILAGENYGNGEGCLARTDEQGTLLWRRNYGELRGSMDVLVTDDGGYVLSGTADGIVRTDSLGVPIWTWPSPHDVTSVAPTANGGFIAVGNSNNVIHLIKLDASGHVTGPSGSSLVGP